MTASAAGGKLLGRAPPGKSRARLNGEATVTRLPQTGEKNRFRHSITFANGTELLHWLHFFRRFFSRLILNYFNLHQQERALPSTFL